MGRDKLPGTRPLSGAMAALALLPLFAAILLAGCIFARTTTTLTKTTRAAPARVTVSEVENGTGAPLVVKSNLLSRLLSTGPEIRATIPDLMAEVVKAELRQNGVEVIERASAGPDREALRVSVLIEDWQEASGPPYGKVAFLTARYRLLEDTTGETLWEVRQDRFPLRIEHMELDRTQAERLLAAAVRDALQYWPK